MNTAQKIGLAFVLYGVITFFIQGFHVILPSWYFYTLVNPLGTIVTFMYMGQPLEVWNLAQNLAFYFYHPLIIALGAVLLVGFRTGEKKNGLKH